MESVFPRGPHKRQEQHMAGKFEQMKGAVKDTVGKATGDTQTQAEGKTDKAQGKAKEVAQDAKDSVKGVSNSLKK